MFNFLLILYCFIHVLYASVDFPLEFNPWDVAQDLLSSNDPYSLGNTSPYDVDRFGHDMIEEINDREVAYSQPRLVKRAFFKGLKRNIKNFVHGFAGSFKETGQGIVQMISHPIMTTEQVVQIAKHPMATIAYIRASVQHMMQKGNRANSAGRVMAELVMALVAAQLLKNVGTLSKTASAQKILANPKTVWAAKNVRQVQVLQKSSEHVLKLIQSPGTFNKIAEASRFAEAAETKKLAKLIDNAKFAEITEAPK